MQVRLMHLSQSGHWPSGNPRWYYRPKGKKGIRMPDLPRDDPGFLEAYIAASGVKLRPAAIEGSLAAGIALYRESDSFRTLAPSTRAQRARILGDIWERYGAARRRDITRAAIEIDLRKHKGHAQINRLKAWRGFCAWMVEHDRLAVDPSDDIKRARVAKTSGHIPWTEEEIAAFREYWPIGTRQRLAFELIHWTGARVSDAVRLGPASVDRDGWLSFGQGKTGGRVSIPLERTLPEFADGMQEDRYLLLRAIGAINDRHLTWMTTLHGAARSSKSVSQWFAAAARKAGLPARTAHGLRKSRAEKLFEHGATMAQAQAWIGHKDPRMLSYYAEKFDHRRALSRTDDEQKFQLSAIQFQQAR